MSETEKILRELQSQGDCFTFDSYEMSGFGRDTSYEMGMQRMLWLGIRWLKGKKIRVFDGMHGYAGIIGVESTELSQLGELEDLWDHDPFIRSGGMTGAMHQFVLRHLKVIAEEGYEGWLRTLRREGAGDSIFKVKMWP